jgi:hypothetical protein
MPINNVIKLRRGNATDWSAINGGDGPTLNAGEPGFEIDSNILKIGDGSTSWKDLKPVGADQSLYKVKNTSGGIIRKGQVVRANGTVGNSDAIQVTLFIADGSVPEYTIMGLATQDMNNNDFGYVTAFGIVKGIDTDPDNLSTNICAAGENWLDGDILYASPTASGKLTKNKPQHDTILATILSSADNGSLFARPTWNPHLDDVHDVNTSGVSNNQYLIYNSETQLWTPTSSGIFNNVYASGNVGIGTSTPSTKLEVVGDFKIDNLKLDGNTISSTNSNGNIILTPNGTGGIAGGSSATVTGSYAVAGGGISNTASGSNSTVGGGCCNVTNARHSTINGGHRNIIQSPTNECCARGATIGGGVGHNSSGGTLNGTTGDLTGTITCCNAGAYSTIGGGLRNIASGRSSAIGGGRSNTASAFYSTVGGGSLNMSSNTGAIVAGGGDNTSSGCYSTVSGGRLNTSSGYYSTVSGGNCNTASGSRSIVSGGTSNTASGCRSTVIGGSDNTVSGSFSSTVGCGNNDNGCCNSHLIGKGLSATASDTTYTNNSHVCCSLTIGSFNHTNLSIASSFADADLLMAVLDPAGTPSTKMLQGSVLRSSLLNEAAALQFRQGTDVERQGITPANGEPIWTTDCKKLYIGDGSTCGGIFMSPSMHTNGSCAGSIQTVSNSNVACGTSSTVSGGNSNCASGISSTVSGGTNNSASGPYSTIIGGFYTQASKYGELSHAAGRFAQTGDAQHTVLIARNNTTNTTTTTLFLDGSSSRLTLPAETTWTFTINLSAYNDTDNTAAWWIIRGGIRRDAANSTSLIGSLIEERDSESTMSNTSVAVTADDTNEALNIDVTGLASKNIRWVAVVDISQVSWGTP